MTAYHQRHLAGEYQAKPELEPKSSSKTTPAATPKPKATTKTPSSSKTTKTK